jgi:hypothetical protein
VRRSGDRHQGRRRRDQVLRQRDAAEEVTGATDMECRLRPR